MKVINLLTSHKNKDIDLPSTTIKRSNELKKKLFLTNIYTEFYDQILSEISNSNKNGKIIELGSGGGFIKRIIPNAITSDIMKLPNIELKFSAISMPFKKDSINVFTMIDVFHHISNVDLFLREVDRTLKKNGQLIMIEPANTLFGSIIYKYFHHEPYNPKGIWKFDEKGPLSGANSALTWIVFVRDIKKFKKKYPNLKIVKICAHTPFKYLLSGGFTFKQLLPNSTYPAISLIERIILPLNKWLGIFYTVSITKIK